MLASEDEPLVVLHSSRTWLQQTKTWIYQQLKWLPNSVEAHVVCEDVENLRQFAVPRLHSLSDYGPARRSLERWLRRRAPPRLWHAVRTAKGVRAKILHSHFGTEACRELPIARAAGLKHVVTFYGYDVNRVPVSAPSWRPRYREMFKRVDRVLCEGPYMRAAIVGLGCPEERVHVQHLGVDLAGIPFTARVWLPGQPLRVLIAGSFREKKGIPYALAALATLKRRRPELDLHVTVVGDAGHAPDEQAEKLRVLAAARELGDRAHLRGFQPYAELFRLAESQHIFLSPSVEARDGDTEGGAPVTVLEMAASGMPVVSSRHCDIPNVLRGPAAALLAPERDVQALVEILEGLVENPGSWLPIVQHVRADIEQRFDVRVQGERLAGHYAAVMDARG